VTPNVIKKIIDPENGSIDEFVRKISKQLRPSSKVLDAGAGSCPYKLYFKHTNYESTDFEDIFDKRAKWAHNFICNLENIPKNKGSYDVIINTQVLEHVPNPLSVLKEFNRILKPGGKLFLTAPQGWGIHGEPYHFFNFTKYGLKFLFEQAGFKIIYIRPRGGIFWYLSKRISTLPYYIYKQYIFRKNNLVISRLLFLPLYLMLALFFSVIIPFILYPLDILDKRKDYTLGYACYCIKI